MLIYEVNEVDTDTSSACKVMQMHIFVIFNLKRKFKKTKYFFENGLLDISSFLNIYFIILQMSHYGNESILEKVLQILIISIVGILVTAMFSFLTALAVWPLWNCLMSALFGLTKITYLQAVGISILSTLLFRLSISWKMDGK